MKSSKNIYVKPNDVMAKTKQLEVGEDGMVDLEKFRQLFEDHYRPLTVFAI